MSKGCEKTMKITKKEIAAAFRTSFPIIVTFIVLGIDFAMTALFTTVFLQQWIDSKCHIPAVTGVLATLACRLVFGPDPTCGSAILF